VQKCRINLDFDLFLKGKVVDRVHRLWTAQEWPVHRSTMDLTVAGGRSSPELDIAAAPGHGDLPRWHGRQKGGAGTLVAGSPWAKGRRGG
jgi:hypothetical protein